MILAISEFLTNYVPVFSLADIIFGEVFRDHMYVIISSLDTDISYLDGDPYRLYLYVCTNVHMLDI